MLNVPHPATRSALCVALVVAALLHSEREASAAPTFQRVSIASDGTQTTNALASDSPTISADGRFVAFESTAPNLVAGDTNGVTDIFVHDRFTGITTRESVSSGGAQSNADSYAPSISADGRFVAFTSSATNLISGGTGGYQVYVRDRALGATTLASVSSGGVPGNGSSLAHPSISADGRFVSFNSDASNLVSGDTNGLSDIFTRDRLSGAITRDSVASDGTQAAGVSGSYDPVLSSDGRYVAFSSGATNLVLGSTQLSAVFVHDRGTGVTTLESIDNGGAQLFGEFPSISGDGRFVAFRRGLSGIYLRDRQTGQTLGSSSFSFVDSPRLSPDGRYLTFSRNGNIPFTGILSVYDRVTGQLTDLVASGYRPAPANNAVVFVSSSALVPADTNGTTDIYVFAEPLAQAGAPSPPAGLTASSSASTVTLTWSAPGTGGAATSYTLEAGSQSGLTDRANFSTGTTATSFLAGGVSPGTYYVRLRASNASGTSAASNEAVLIVGANCTAPGAPSNLSATVSGSTVTLTWVPGAGATSYLLLVGSTTGGNDILASDLGSSTTSLFAMNVAARTYFVRLQSLSACGQSPASNEALVIVR